MDVTIEIISAQVDDLNLAAIAELYRRVWPNGSPRREQKARWAFAGNSLGRAPLLLAVNENGAVLGVRGGMPWSIDLGDGVPRRGVQLHGTAVDTSIRRQGVFSNMTRVFVESCREDNVPLIFNVSAPESRAGYERLGWTYTDSLRSMFLPIRPVRVARQLAGQSLRPRVPTRAFSEPPSSYRSVVGLMAGRERSLSGLMHTSYTPEFYAWRFSSEDYRWLGNPECGYIVYKMLNRGNLLEMLIGDVWPGNKTVAKLVLRAIKRERPDLVTSWTTVDHPLYRPLRRFGFLVQPGRSLNLGIRRIDEELPTLAYGLMAADIDTF